MALQRRLARVGIAKQTAKGSPAASPTFGFGVTDGSVRTFDVSDEMVPVTSVSPFNMAANRDSIRAGAEFETLAFPRMLGLLLASVLGSHSTSGAGPYTHTITPGDDGYYLSIFGRLAAEYDRVDDCKIDTLTLEWDTDGKLRVSVTFWGITYTGGTASWTATVDEDELTFLNARGIAANPGAFSLDGATAKIASGSVEISQDITGTRLAASHLDDDEVRGNMAGTISLTLVPDDWVTFKRGITGAAAGTTVARTPFFGACSLKWAHDADTDLTIACNRLQYVAEFPDADPEGGPAEVSVEGNILRPSGANAITATLRNAQSSY